MNSHFLIGITHRYNQPKLYCIKTFYLRYVQVFALLVLLQQSPRHYIIYPQTQYVIYTATEQDNDINSDHKEIVL